MYMFQLISMIKNTLAYFVQVSVTEELSYNINTG